MVNSIGTSSSSALPATPAAVSARSKTAAGQKLDAALDSLKAGNGVAATNQAKRQMDQARVKLAGLMLAAGSAAAMGNGRMARNVADDIRTIARDLSRTLSASGSTGSSVTPPKPEALTLNAPPVTDASKPLSAAQSAAAQIRAELGFGPAGSKGAGNTGAGNIPAADLATLKTEAGTLMDALKKVMKKVQFAGMNPMLETRDRATMQSMFGDANRELANLKKALAPSAGAKVNLSA
jgi:hypothetical protein